ELAATDLGSDVGGSAAAAADGDAELRGVIGTLDGAHLRRITAGHERLAGADVDVHRAVALGSGVYRYVPAQLVDELVALVHQLVGRLAGGGSGGDLPVERGNVAGDAVDLRDIAPQLCLELRAELRDLRIVGGELLCERLRLVEQRLAGRARGGCIGDGLQRIDEAL